MSRIPKQMYSIRYLKSLLKRPSCVHWMNMFHIPSFKIWYHRKTSHLDTLFKLCVSADSVWISLLYHLFLIWRAIFSMFDSWFQIRFGIWLGVFFTWYDSFSLGKRLNCLACMALVNCHWIRQTIHCFSCSLFFPLFDTVHILVCNGVTIFAIKCN